MKFTKAILLTVVMTTTAGGILGGFFLEKQEAKETGACLFCHETSIIDDSVHSSLTSLCFIPELIWRIRKPKSL